MNKIIYLLLTSFVFISSSMLLSSCESNVKGEIFEKEIEVAGSDSAVKNKLLRHVVLFNFSDDATDVIVKEIEQEFTALSNQISEIHSFEWGINNSTEGLDKNLTHCFLVTFLSEKNREIYLPHPLHQKFVTFIGPYVEDVTVVDYWTK